jgi:uncharacterized membrane protein YgcG
MSRLHATFVALALGAAAVAGLSAAARTVRLGQKTSAPQSTHAAAREIAFRRAKLARWSRSLSEARVKHPPALPKIPKFAPVQRPPAVAAASPSAAVEASSVTYVRGKAVVKYRHATAPPTTTTTPTSWSDDGESSGDAGPSDGGTGEGGGGSSPGGGD